MVEDKYVGVALAVSSSFAIGTSFIITKKGLLDAAKRSTHSSATDGLAYLKNPIWWAGLSTLVLGEIANFAAYIFAPPVLVTPLGALSVIIGAILASFLLNEQLGHLGRLGCTLCLIGSLIIVLHAPADKEMHNIDEMLAFARQPGFLLYCFSVLVFVLFMIYVIGPKHGRTNPVVYISICSLVGSISVMAIKGFGLALKLTLEGQNQFSHPSTYVFMIISALCILVQMNYLNKALDLFTTNVVNPMYFVGFSSATFVASLILFQGFTESDTSNTISLVSGFVVTFLGVHLLNLSRQVEEDLAVEAPSTLEAGLVNPRLSLTGRMSMDGWGDMGTPRSANFGHGRRSSIYRAQTSTLFNTFEEDGDVENVGLHRLREDPREDEDEDADERTALRSAGIEDAIKSSRSPIGHRNPRPPQNL